ncbi:hypothetical protein B0J14DRAFT_289234 [Halenospora varia]|nr:hypothetical protein B0J14DRAFT_289234 [Halenospora varia]
MEITFVPQQTGDSPKRKRFNKACERCRKRKKRCIHETEEAVNVSDSEGPRPGTSSKRKSNPLPLDSQHPQPQMSGSEAATASAVHPVSNSSPDTCQPSPSGSTTQVSQQGPETNDAAGSIATRFVGDLNPEAIFLDHPALNARTTPLRDHVGVWLEKGDWEAVLREKDTAQDLRADNSEDSNNDLSGALPRTPLIRKAGPNILAVSDQAALIDVYFSRIHPILPLLSDAEFHEGLRTSNLPDSLLQAVCLVAAKDTKAAPYLRLRPGTVCLKPREFSNAIYSSLLNSIRLGTVRDKITLIRVLALMSLHIEGPEGADDSSFHLTQAIHHAQTIGLHLKRPGVSQSEKRLFWCLWGMDKLNAAMHGRPIMISDHDLGISAFVSESPDEKPFELWLKILTILSKVIGLYRPTSDPSVTGWEDDFIGFEEILDEVDAWSISSTAIVTLHVLYLAVAILSCRLRSSLESGRGTTSFLRQSLSALQLIALMCGDMPTDTYPLPFVPYGMSLALSVSYKRMRQSRLPHQQKQARNEFEQCCGALAALKSTWWSAEIMAGLSQRVLQEVNKVRDPSNLRIRSRRQSFGNARNEKYPLATGPPQVAQNSATSHLHPALLNPNSNAETSDHQTGYQPSEANQPSLDVEFFDVAQTCFDDIDNIFGDYLDPNFPVNYEDFMGLSSTELEWNP